jgi:hypothetical protein
MFIAAGNLYSMLRQMRHVASGGANDLCASPDYEHCVPPGLHWIILASRAS